MLKTIKQSSLFLLLLLTIVTAAFQFAKPSFAFATRGVSGDYWADLILGKRDFSEISARKVVNYKVNEPGGVVVDHNASSSGEMYVWDSGNSRVLGIDLATCYAGSTACVANIVIGQPYDTDYGACNLDSSYQDYPNRPAATANTLCGVAEFTHTTLEDKTFNSMYVASDSSLFVPDVYNQRVLKYNSPLTTDKTADDVWGQTNYSNDLCNQGGSPSSTSLCFIGTIDRVGGGVTLDASGNMWVADGGNNRVLRYPKDPVTGVISHTADLVLGQSSFTTNSSGTGLAAMHGPIAVRFDAAGTLYVVDVQNTRVLTFTGPFTSGMSGATFGTGFTAPGGIEYDSSRNSMWVFDNLYVKEFDLSGTLLKTSANLGNPGAGSIALDNSNNILASTYVYGQDVYRIHDTAGSFTIDKSLFSPPTTGYNLTASNRLEQGGIGSLAVVGSQLMATDGRLLFWNNIATASAGQTPSGYVGGSSFTDLPGYWILKADASNHVWTVKNGNSISVYATPLTSGATPIKTLTSPLNMLGGGTIAFTSAAGIVPSSDSSYLWISDSNYNRVIRVKNPLTASPVVDIVLGQTNSTGTSCNQGLVAAPNTNPGRSAASDATLNELCSPGMLSLDKYNNLYISDHWLESAGNWRLLMFSASQFPSAPSSPIYNLTADKEFPRITSTNTQAHATFETAFDSHNRMVAGYNPYFGNRFVEYYNDPTRINASNHSDPAYALPDGAFKDFYGWGVGMAFDSSDNLWTYDTNRGQIKKYLAPLPPVVAHVQSASGVSICNNPTTMTLTKTVGANNLLVVSLAYKGTYTVQSASDISDSQGNTWSTAAVWNAGIGNAQRSMTMFYTKAASSSADTITLNCPPNDTANTEVGQYAFHEFSGIATASAVLNESGYAFDSSSTQSINTLTSNVNNQELVVADAMSVNSASYTATGSATVLATQTSATSKGSIVGGYQLLNPISGGISNITFKSYSPSTTTPLSIQWLGVIGTFKLN